MVALRLWAIATFLRIVIQLARSALTNADATPAVQQLIEFGESIVNQLKGKRITLFFFRILDKIVSSVVELYDQIPSQLQPNALIRLVALAESALHSFESTVAQLPPPKIPFLARLKRAETCQSLARFHSVLGWMYMRLNVGDVTQSLETALRHYRSAVSITGEANLLLLEALHSARLGGVLIAYPTEHPELYAREAISAFLKAKDAQAPLLSSIRAMMDEMAESRSFIRAVRKSGGRALVKLLKVARLTQNDPDIAKFIQPEYAASIDASIGLSYAHLSERNKALDHFNLALYALSTEVFRGQYSTQRAEIFTLKGDEYLNVQRQNCPNGVGEALMCFEEALDELSEDPPSRTHACSLIIKRAQAWIQLADIHLSELPHPEDGLAGAMKDLHTGARLARTIGDYGLVQQAYFSLGEGYAKSGEVCQAFRALVLSQRVADRVYKRARTPRLKRYLVGVRTRCYELLTSLALDYSFQLQQSTHDKRHEMVCRVALRYAERGRTRFLQEHLASCNLLPSGATEDDVEDLFRLRRFWHDAELKLIQQESISASTLEVAPIEIFRHQRNRLESDYFRELQRVRNDFEDQDYEPDQPLSEVRWDEIAELINSLSVVAKTALVEYFVTERELVVFVILPSIRGEGSSLVFQSCRIGKGELDDLAGRWFQGCAKLRNLENPLHPVQWERGYLIQVLDRLSGVANLTVKAIREWEQSRGERISRILLVPHRFLHLLPLHALRLPGNQYWGERFSIQYVPSASILWRLVHSKPSAVEDWSLKDLGTGYKERARIFSYLGDASRASMPLPFSQWEARTVSEAMNGKILQGEAVTPSRVLEETRDATYVHIACHASIRPDAPLDGGLQLACPRISNSREPGPNRPKEATDTSHQRNPSILTLGDIIQKMRLDRSCLVVLSACETGITEIESLHDEYIGLPAGFLYAGARTVISMLWPVSDMATWLLMSALSQDLANNVPPAIALQRAQHRLRELPIQEALRTINYIASHEEDPCLRQQMTAETHRLEQLHHDGCPFQSPYWWAGVTVNGL